MAREHPYEITLSCGHTFKCSGHPFRDNTTYACKYKTGCGYRLRWTRYRLVGADTYVENRGRR